MGAAQTIALIAMILISFTNLFGLGVAGISVCLGVIFFFVDKAMAKRPFAGSGLDFSALGSNLKGKSIWFWIAMPIIMDAFSIALSQLVLPEYISHVLTRAGTFVSYGDFALLLVQLVVLALGEEIAWRAFFQQQLLKVLPITPVLLVSSVCFALGHIAGGDPIVVAYDIFFVFVNSVLYGIIFHKTNNAWVSTLSHFAANLFSIIILVFI